MAIGGDLPALPAIAPSAAMGVMDEMAGRPLRQCVCVCGGPVLIVEYGDVPSAVRRHNRSREHQRWRRRMHLEDEKLPLRPEELV